MRSDVLTWVAGAVLALSGGASVMAQPEAPVALNLRMAELAAGSPMARRARHRVQRAIASLRDPRLAQASREALLQPGDCIRHRAGLDEQGEESIVVQLKAAGFLPADMPMAQARFGLFPPLAGEGGACPHLLWPVLASAGGNSRSHHSWPGGLAVHTAGNLSRGARIADRFSVRRSDGWRAAILWHDWGKALVLPWQADGLTRPELTVAGTGAHHILGLAEALRRGLPAPQLADQACAHGLPGVDGQPVAGWLQAAAIIARMPAAAAPVPALTLACRINFEADQGWRQDDADLAQAEARLRDLVRQCGPMQRQDFEARVKNATFARWGTGFSARRLCS